MSTLTDEQPEFTMESYQHDALVLESPVTDAVKERTRKLMPAIMDTLGCGMFQGKMADNLKRRLFYGQEGLATNFCAIDLSPEQLHRLEEMIRPIHAFLGLFGECEEIAKVIGDYIVNGTKPDDLNCEEEAGDFLWYLNQWLSCFGSNIPKAAKRNIAKLRKRYPNKFSEQAAQNRDVAAERAAMASQ